jgi:hypothetical protein
MLPGIVALLRSSIVSAERTLAPCEPWQPDGNLPPKGVAGTAACADNETRRDERTCGPVARRS